MRLVRRVIRGTQLLLAALTHRGLLVVALLAASQAHGETPPSNLVQPAAPSEAALRLPADKTTGHTLELPARSLGFRATAGAIRLTDDKNAPRADLAFIAYILNDAEPRNRPVTFAFNGGPGFASGWLNVGAVGPWRIPLGGDATSPSASPDPHPNAETWLDFTDLVFIDPAGTGYSLVRAADQDDRHRMWSVDGDITYLAEAIRRWLDQFDRNVSPKYILGESYGGFRAPRLARALARSQGTGISGLILLSPALDDSGRSQAFDPFAYVTRLPSMAAAARAAHGTITREQLADVEHYAATEYLVDLTRGESDGDAIARRSSRVAEFTNLDLEVVKRHHGLIDNDVYLREVGRAEGRVGSEYDATITGAAPFPLATSDTYADPILDALEAPVSSAMVTIYETRLNWRPDTIYQLWNQSANRGWEWGRGYGNHPQSLGALREALALDPHLSVLIVHGLFDLVTPYFATQLLLDQIPASGGAGRVRLLAYHGGHMFYTDDASRAALHDAAKVLYGAP
jgi:carboxypeptidase C (cathepsin A)